MAFALQSDITIGEYKRVKPIDVKVTRSMYEYVDKAVIKLPLSARIKIAGEVVTGSIETPKLIEEGMKVTINLGYNGSLKTEFDGFVSRVNLTSPCEVICEGYSYQLRKRTYARLFKNAELKEVLQYLVEGTDIVLDAAIPGFKIEKLLLQDHSGTEALELIKKISDNTIRIFFTGNMLYAGLEYLKTKAAVKYRLGWNVIKDGKLKLREAKNEDVTVNYIGEKKDGTTVKVKANNRTVTRDNVIKTTGSAGTTGETKVIKTHAVTDEKTLTGMASAKLKSLSYNGYEGKISTFLFPYCEPGYKAIIDDRKFPERSGDYLVDSVETTYGTSGARRTVGIAFKL